MYAMAGDVRDMDVLVGLSSSLKPGGEDQCLVQLLEYLGRRRAKDAAKLHKAGKKSSKSSPVPMNASLIGATSRLAG
jgi:hypothetical protein